MISRNRRFVNLASNQDRIGPRGERLWIDTSFMLLPRANAFDEPLRKPNC